MNKFLYHITIGLTIAILFSNCSAKIVSRNYYQENKTTVDKIEQNYSNIYRIQPFSLSFGNVNQTSITLEINTDSLKYVYEFGTDETRISDTLKKFNIPVNPFITLVNDMKKVKSLWVTQSDYYVDNRKKRVTYISAKPKLIRYPLSQDLFYCLAYFPDRQVTDDDGRLLQSRRDKRLRKLRGQVFYKINDRVFYTITQKFR